MKKIVGIVLGVLLLGFVLAIGAEKWISHKLESSINTRDTRNYDLLFEEVDVKLFQGRVDLNHIRLVPLKEDLPVQINGSLDRMKLSRVNLFGFIFNKEIEIGELRLVKPSFRMIKKDSSAHNKEGSKEFQNLFGDLVSRGIIHNFVIEDGTAELLVQEDSLRRFGTFTDLNIYAEGVQTDSVIVSHVVPFQLDQIMTGIKNLKMELSAGHKLEVASINFNLREQYLSLQGISMNYDQDLVEKSFDETYQTDLIELDLKELRFENLDARSDLYGNWSVISQMMIVDSLVMNDVRNKNRPRPEEPIKPMFGGMLAQVPFPLDVDTLLVKNTTISYLEIPEGQRKGGEIRFENMEAKILGLITVDSLQQSQELTIDVTTSLLGKAPIEAKFRIPYHDDFFSLDLTIGEMNLEQLNPLLLPLAQITLESGTLHKLHLKMEAHERIASAQLIFDYENLKLEVHKGANSGQVKGGASMLANMAIRSENLPSKKNYRTANYQTARNMYRSPFNYIWLTTKSGLMEIAPGGLVKLLSQNDIEAGVSKKAGEE